MCVVLPALSLSRSAARLILSAQGREELLLVLLFLYASERDSREERGKIFYVHTTERQASLLALQTSNVKEWHAFMLPQTFIR